MNEFRADLHCHSKCSDGSDLPIDLLMHAKKAGLSGLSITDHDTCEAYTPELLSKGIEIGIQILTGIELSTSLQDQPVHVLGYGFDIQSAPFFSFIQNLQKKRVERNAAIYEKLRKKKIVLPNELLTTQRVIGRPHFAKSLVENGHAKSIKEAFQLFLKEGALCYVPGVKPTPQEAIEAIHAGNGKAVLAHPHFLKKNLLRILLSQPFDGIECYYGDLHDEARFLALAEERKWIGTGGSDYHGVIKPHIPIGRSWVNQEVFELLSSK